MTGFGALAMEERGLGGGAYLLSLFSGAYVITRLLAHGLPDRLGPTRVVLASGILEAVGLILIALGTDWWVSATGAVVAGGGFALLYPSIAMIGVTNAPESERGATLGAISSFLDLSVGIAGVVGGAVAAVSYPVVFLLSAALAFAAIIAGTSARRASAR